MLNDIKVYHDTNDAAVSNYVAPVFDDTAGATLTVTQPGVTDKHLKILAVTGFSTAAAILTVKSEGTELYSVAVGGGFYFHHAGIYRTLVKGDNITAELSDATTAASISLNVAKF